MEQLPESGTLNPWRLRKTYHDFPDWNDDTHQTPFGAMCELISQWPGAELISQQSHAIRHRKFLEMIAGYSMVLNGRRPLDVPLHPRSLLSFKLVSFLDKILPINGDKEWHSVSTMLLHFDLTVGKDQSAKTFQKFFHHFLHSIRVGSTYHGKRYDDTYLHEEEINFITVLHSQDHDRKGYWPTINKTGHLDFGHLPESPKLYLNSLSERSGRNLNLHTFKFAKIQTWIGQWSYLNRQQSDGKTGIIKENNAHPFFVGASSLIDSISATIRSHILAEKRPGSIVIDGGGRISYLSHQSHEEETRWLASVVSNSLMLQGEHTNPFNSLIAGLGSTYLHSDTVQSAYKTHNIDVDSLKKEENSSPNSNFFRMELGKGRVAQLLPQIHYYEAIETVNENQQPSILLERSTRKSWRESNCVLCNHMNSTDAFDSPHSILRAGKFVCFFHFILHSIGKMTILRNKSMPFLFSGMNMVKSREGTTVRHLLKFDGNAIGSLFLDHVYDLKGDVVGLDEQLKSQIVNLNHEIDLTAHSIKQHRKVINEIVCLRHHSLILRQRRSTVFNSSWWSSLHTTLRDSNIKDFSPWIIAGDDVLFANESYAVDENSIITWLQSFVQAVSKQLGNVPLSIAGGIHKRGEGESIFSCYKRVCRLEEMSGYAWKRLHLESKGKYVPEEKQIKLEQFEQDNSVQFLQLINWLREEKNGFMFNHNGMKNIILPTSWNNSPTSEPTLPPNETMD